MTLSFVMGKKKTLSDLQKFFVNSLSEIINSPLVPRSIHDIVTFLLGGNLLAELPDKHLPRMFLISPQWRSWSFVGFPEVSCLADLHGLCCFFRNVSKGSCLKDVMPRCDTRLLKREQEWSLSCSFTQLQTNTLFKIRNGADEVINRKPHPPPPNYLLV